MITMLLAIHRVLETVHAAGFFSNRNALLPEWDMLLQK
jgi:hypothetical protein